MSKESYIQANFAAILVCIAFWIVFFVYALPTAIDREAAYTEEGLNQSISKIQRMEIMENHK
jgi:hypothetical protein